MNDDDWLRKRLRNRKGGGCLIWIGAFTATALALLLS